MSLRSIDPARRPAPFGAVAALQSMSLRSIQHSKFIIQHWAAQPPLCASAPLRENRISAFLRQRTTDNRICPTPDDLPLYRRLPGDARPPPSFPLDANQPPC